MFKKNVEELLKEYGKGNEMKGRMIELLMIIERDNQELNEIFLKCLRDYVNRTDISDRTIYKIIEKTLNVERKIEILNEQRKWLIKMEKSNLCVNNEIFLKHILDTCNELLKVNKEGPLGCSIPDEYSKIFYVNDIILNQRAAINDLTQLAIKLNKELYEFSDFVDEIDDLVINKFSELKDPENIEILNKLHDSIKDAVTSLIKKEGPGKRTRRLLLKR